ncbi:hypothetical protein GCM10027402_06480 [Arthrobacter monumenti]
MMNPAEQWMNYRRDKLPQGWSYPLGQEDFRTALSHSELRINSLSLIWLRPRERDSKFLLTVDWFSDAQANYFGVAEATPVPLRIMHHAVPARLRQQIRHAMLDLWLQRAVEWATAAPTRGNAWTASDHSWHLLHTVKGEFIVEEH